MAAVGSTSTTLGTVLMNRPTMPSTPSRSDGRPDTVSPKATTRLPVIRDSSTAHANCRIVLTVTPRSRASRLIAAVVPASIHSSWLRGNEVVVASSAPETSVGSSSGDSTSRHAARPAARSVAARRRT